MTTAELLQKVEESTPVHDFMARGAAWSADEGGCDIRCSVSASQRWPDTER